MHTKVSIHIHTYTVTHTHVVTKSSIIQVCNLELDFKGAIVPIRFLFDRVWRVPLVTLRSGIL